MDPRTRLLLEAPVTPTIVRLALPNVVVMVVQASIGLIETYFVAKLGLDALAGMALVFPLFMLLQMVSAGAMGGGILSAIARALGAGNRERANELVWSAVAITVDARRPHHLRWRLLFGPKLYALMGGRGGRSRRRRPIRPSFLPAPFRSGCSTRLPRLFAAPAICYFRQPSSRVGAMFPDSAVAAADLRPRAVSASRHRRRRRRGAALLRDRLRDLCASTSGPAAACSSLRGCRRV